METQDPLPSRSKQKLITPIKRRIGLPWNPPISHYSRLEWISPRSKSGVHAVCEVGPLEEPRSNVLAHPDQKWTCRQLTSNKSNISRFENPGFPLVCLCLKHRVAIEELIASRRPKTSGSKSSVLGEVPNSSSSSSAETRLSRSTCKSRRRLKLTP